MLRIATTFLRRSLPFLAIAALSLLLAPSVFTPGQMLCTAVDAPHFLYRLHEISWLLDRGVLWPRWGPNLSYGYGYPVFHYYGSLSFYPSLLLHKLGTTLLASFQAGFWLAAVCSGWAAFLWLRSVMGDGRAALIGAVAYVYVPYHINTIVYRWNMPEPWALAFAPLVLYGMHRLARRLDWQSVSLTALALAALPLTSNLATVVFAPPVVSYALLLLALSSERKVLLWRLLAAAALAAGLSAFFVVPAFIDRSAVQIERGFRTGGTDVLSNFLPLARAFQQPFVADVSRANAQYDPLSLGPLVLGASAAVLLAFGRRLPRSARSHVYWATAVLAMCVLLATRAADPLYRALPFLQVLQFPWRFLAPATLLVAALAGIAAQTGLSALSDRWANVATVLVAGLVVVQAWSLLYPGALCGTSPSPTLKQAVAAQVGMVGTISTNAEYLPADVERVPDSSPMYDDYMAERPVVRWDETSLPHGAQTLATDDDGLRALWRGTTPVPTRLVYQAFAFPGWRAAVDGRPVAIHPVAPHGLIGVDVPEGDHVVTVRFGTTPQRVASAIVSTAALFVALGLLFLPRLVPVGPTSNPTLPTSAWLAVAAVGVTLLAVRAGLVDRHNLWPRVRRYDGETVRGIADPLSVTFSEGERLVGYKLHSYPGSDGTPLVLDLYWASSSGADMRALVRLTDEDGRPWTEWDRIVHWPGLIGPPAPRIWGPDRYTTMRHLVDIPLGTPPGTYQLTVATIDPGTRAPRFVVQGTPLTAERTAAVIASVTVARRKPGAAAVRELVPQPPPAGQLALLGCDADKKAARVGETVVLSPLWHALSPVRPEIITLALVDDASGTALQQKRPFSPRFPPAEWQIGEVVRDRLDVLVPASLTAGHYAWVAEVGEQTFTLGELDVRVPERDFDAPRDIVHVGEVLDGFAGLIGYRAEELVPGEPWTVTLYWRSEAETTTSYKVFVHLLDEEGRVVAQSDTIPASWLRPTTGWLPPEVIEDTHVLHVPQGVSAHGLHGVVGLYEPHTGMRATTPEGESDIALSEDRHTIP